MLTISSVYIYTHLQSTSARLCTNVCKMLMSGDCYRKTYMYMYYTVNTQQPVCTKHFNYYTSQLEYFTIILV